VPYTSKLSIIFIYLDLCKILLLEKILLLWKKHEEFFAYKTKKFWEDKIFKLPERHKVVEKNGEYIIE